MSKRTLAFISIFFMVSFVLCPAAMSATITVDTVDDIEADDGQCSLREAISAANDNAAGTSNCVAGDDIDDEIVFDPIVFDPLPPEEVIPLDSSLPPITHDLIITGPGADALTIDGLNTADGIFTIDSGGNSQTVEISGLMLWRGSGVNGGAVFVNIGDTLHISFSVVSDNAVTGDGGGIFNDSGTVVVIECDIDDNEADGLGGGISNLNGLVQLFDSTVSNNTSDGDGGGIHNGGGTVEITGSTIWRNVSLARGSGIENLDTAELVNTTVSGNIGIGLSNATIATATLTNCTVADNSGLGISNDAVGIVSLKNTIVADNNDIFDECVGIIQSEGNNLASDFSCGLTEPTDLPDTDPLLGPLEDNGGPTFTHALDLASPAIDAGEGLLWITTDQRGIDRPQDGNGDRVAYFDIGSYEFVLILVGGGGGSSSFCFIATAAYGSDTADEVITLRRFRDNILLKYSLGRAFVRFYYSVSPPIAGYIARHDSLRAAVRLSLAPLVYGISYPCLSVLIFFCTMIGAVLSFRAMRSRLVKS